MKPFLCRKPLFKPVVAAMVLILIMNSVALSQGTPRVDSKQWTAKFDGHFRKYSKRFFGVGFDWRWFKAQAIAESSLKEDAKSWVGAKGVMQIVPRTFAEIQEKNPSFININEPRWNIAAGIYYDSQQYRRWKDITSSADKMSFMFASYNAGRRTILNAQRVSKREGLPGISWRDIESIAPKVPRWRHKETLQYIKKIFDLMGNQAK